MACKTGDGLHAFSRFLTRFFTRFFTLFFTAFFTGFFTFFSPSPRDLSFS